MYDFDLDLPFELGNNLETFAFIINIIIPILYFANFVYMLHKLRGMEKNATFYPFIRSLVYFFFFYGLGATFFVWYDFLYMDFQSPNPILVAWEQEEIEIMAIHLWKIGNLLQLVGLVLMLIQLRKRIFKEKLYLWLPIIWELATIVLLIFIGFIPGLSIADVFLWSEIIFLLSFIWAISLPLTYAYVTKISTGHVRRYAFVLFACFIAYGVAWGFRSRLILHVALVAFSLIPDSIVTFTFAWWLRALVMIISLSLILVAYRELLKEF